MTYSVVELNKALDSTKAAIFIRRKEGHLAHILCNCPLIWAEDALTGYTNGLNIVINPNFFMKLAPEVRETFIAHLLWHVAMMHILGAVGRDLYLWQMACDYWINNLLHEKGYSFKGVAPWLDLRYVDQAPEQIYEDLLQRQEDETLDDLDALWGYQENGAFDRYDLRLNTEAETAGEPSGAIPEAPTPLQNQLKNLAVQAAEYAAQSHGGYSGSHPLLDMVNQFLAPKIAWEKELIPFLTALEGEDRTWARPSRRYPDTYMPSVVTEGRGGLAHIACFGDSSGSITKAQLVRINSEARAVWKRFNPSKLTLADFDDEIRKEIVMERGDPFEEMVVVGRGGTDLSCVRQWIIENKPEAVIIFTDMGCAVMEPLPPESMVPILWIVINNPSAEVPHGRMIHIKE